MKKMMKLFLMATMVFSVAMTFSSCSSDDDAPMALTTNDKLVDMIVGTWTVEPGYYETNNTYTYAVSHMTVTASRQAIDNTDQTAYTIRVNIGTNAVSITYDVATQSEQRITTPYDYSWSTRLFWRIQTGCPMPWASHNWAPSTIVWSQTTVTSSLRMA